MADILNQLVIQQYKDLSTNYEVKERIGKGAFAEVFMIKEKSTNEMKAVKVISLVETDLNINTTIDKLKREAETISRLDHPNILKFYECFQFKNHFCIVTEYCQETLVDVLNKYGRERKKVDEKLMTEWFYKLALGLDYLHNRNDGKIIHRDLKPQNILFKNNEIKIADFGESKQILNKTLLTTVCGTYNYMSPEILNDETYNEKTDIWSLGCVFYEIFFLKQAFQAENINQLKNNVFYRRINGLNNDKSDFIDLINKMICVDKTERPSTKDILSHKIFTPYSNENNSVTERTQADANNVEPRYRNTNRNSYTNNATINENKDVITRLSNQTIVDNKEPKENRNSISDNAKKNMTENIFTDLYKETDNNNNTDLIEMEKINLTALMNAKKNQKDIEKFLIENKALINNTDFIGWTVLMEASLNGYKDVVIYLLNNKADVNMKNFMGSTALMHASTNGHKDIVQLLIENKASVNETDKDGRSALMNASLRGHFMIVKLLIDSSADVNKKDVNGWTALMDASSEGHENIVELLISNKANVNERNKFNWTALMRASMNGHKNIVQLLITNKANVNDINQNYRTALILASWYGHSDVVQLLINNAANVDYSDLKYLTSLMLASHYGHLNVVQVLVDKKADINLKNGNGLTAIKAAFANNHSAIVDYLQSKGAVV